MADTLDRKYIGTRVSYVLVAVLCYFGTLAVLQHSAEILNQDQVWSALQWLIGAIGVAIMGDTARPSGKKSASFGVAAVKE